jgi:hypothetical protein
MSAIPPMPKGFVDPYAPDAASRLDEAMNQVARPVGDDELVSKLAAFLEPDIMAKTGKDWEWRQGQERKYARRALEAIGYADLQTRLERYRESGREIANIARYWVKYTRESREREGLETTPDTHIMMPTWPSIGQMEAWVKALSDGGVEG